MKFEMDEKEAEYLCGIVMIILLCVVAVVWVGMTAPKTYDWRSDAPKGTELPHNLSPEQVEWNCRMLDNKTGCNGVLP